MRAMRSTLVPVLLEHAARHGCAAGSIADRLGLPEAGRSMATWSLDSPAVSIASVVALADELAVRLADAELGLSLSRELPRGTYGVGEFAQRNAPTLGEAAQRCVKYEGLSNDRLQYFSDHDEEASWIGYLVPGYPKGLGPHLDTFQLGVILRFIRELGGDQLTPREVEFTHAAPRAPRSALVAHFACDNLRFGAGRCALTFAREVWDLPVRGADPALLPLLDTYASKLMPMENVVDSWRSRVRDHLRRQLSGGAPTIARTAETLGLPVRTLQRRLREETGQTYRQIVDELREEEARRLIGTTEVPIDEVSFLLGFSERRAFARAFARWTSSSPARYREHGPDAR